jgi:hypothetical protein
MTKSLKIILAVMMAFQIVFFIMAGIMLNKTNSTDGGSQTPLLARKEDLSADGQKLIAVISELNSTISLESARLASLKARIGNTSLSQASLKEQALLAQKSKEAAAAMPSLPTVPTQPSSPPVITRAS